MAVKLYTLEELKAVGGLYPEKALAKMNGDMEIYSTLLDKYLNQTPRTIPRLKQLLKENKLAEYAEELKDLRIDLADIFALTLLERANILYDTAVKGETARCVQQLEPFLQSLQAFSYELKQCRTQEGLDNEGEAANKAAELDIGASVVNSKYSTVNKAKFIDLYGRIDGGLIDKAANLTNVLKAMGYDSELNKHLEDISAYLSLNKHMEALDSCARLLTILGCAVPESKAKKFALLILDDSPLAEQIARVLGDSARVIAAAAPSEARQRADVKPDFILINNNTGGMDGFAAAEQLAAGFQNVKMGFVFSKASAGDIVRAQRTGAVEMFLLPLDETLFLEKMKKYMK